MKKVEAVSLGAVYTHTHTHTSSLIDKRIICKKDSNKT